VDRILADFAYLEDAEDAFSQILGALRQTLNELDRNLMSTLSEWEGEARDAHQQAHREWRATASHMADRLARLKKVISISHQNFRSSRAANQTIWRGGGS
jgi:WXG100 family type VII secretion target